MISVKDTVQTVDGRWGDPVDAKNNPSQVQAGSVQMNSSDESIVTVQKDPDAKGDELTFRLTFSGKTGTFTIGVQADADLTDAEADITGSFNGEVVAGQAVGFGAPSFTPADGVTVS